MAPGSIVEWEVSREKSPEGMNNGWVATVGHPGPPKTVGRVHLRAVPPRSEDAGVVLHHLLALIGCPCSGGVHSILAYSTEHAPPPERASRQERQVLKMGSCCSRNCPGRLWRPLG